MIEDTINRGSSMVEKILLFFEYSFQTVNILQIYRFEVSFIEYPQVIEDARQFFFVGYLLGSGLGGSHAFRNIALWSLCFDR